MSGTRRMIVGDITHSKLRGKALADELARELNSQERHVSQLKKAMPKRKNKTYGTK